MTQRNALDILKTGANVFLTGAAGSGKTHALNEYIRTLKERGISAGITASTGIAATHIGGLTIHSWAGIGIARDMDEDQIRVVAENQRIAKRMRRTRVLVVDEISMLDADRLDLVDRVARLVRGSDAAFGGMQVVVCGDFFQLPPVWREGEERPRFAYEARSWQDADFKICYLHERHRHEDEAFYAMLDAIREARVDDVVRERLAEARETLVRDTVVTRLYSHNADVDAQNARELARIAGKEMRYTMRREGIANVTQFLQKGCLAPETLVLKKGAAVMFVKNNFEEGYVNGTLGTVEGFSVQGMPLVRTARGKVHEVSPAVWSAEDNGRVLGQISQIPLRLAWAITVHKSQGMTLDGAHVDLSGAFEAGMGYVALSRVRSFEHLCLLGCNERALEVHEDVLTLDGILREASARAEEELAAIPRDRLGDMQEAFLVGAKGSAGADAKKERGATLERTREFLVKGFTPERIARERNLKLGTILDHLEKLAERDENLDFSGIVRESLEDGRRLEEIKEAFLRAGKDEYGHYPLAPAKELLGNGYSYEELRMVRLCLK